MVKFYYYVPRRRSAQAMLLIIELLPQAECENLPGGTFHYYRKGLSGEAQQFQAGHKWRVWKNRSEEAAVERAR